MFELRKSFPFEACHQLVHHDGKCRNMHGHSYLLTVELRSPHLITHGSKRNMVTDFSDISRPVRKLVRSHLDHHHLNETLGNDSPTAEFIAHWCYYRLKPEIPNLTAIEIRETATSSATYRPSPNCAHCALCPACHAPTLPSRTNGVSNGNGIEQASNGVVNCEMNAQHNGEANGVTAGENGTIQHSTNAHLIDR